MGDTEVAYRQVGTLYKDIFLATKVWNRMSGEPNALGGSRHHIIEGCEDSLRRLKTDYIDLYQLHRPDPHIAIDETLRALDDLVSSGKIRYAGTSNFGAWQIVESLWASEKLGKTRFISDQSPFNLADRRPDIIPRTGSHSRNSGALTFPTYAA